MSMNGIAKIFDGATKTGKVQKRSLTAKQIRIALSQANYLDFFAKGNEAEDHIISGRGIEWKPDFSSPVERYIKVGVKQDFHVPTISSLIKSNLNYNYSALKMMRMGFDIIAEAMKMQRSGLVEPRIVEATVSTAGQAIAFGFQYLNGGKRGLENNKIDRRNAENIAQRIFKVGLHHNKI